MSQLKYFSSKASILLKFKRNLSSLTNEAKILHRAQIFNEEKNRQTSLIERIEKIEVKHIGPEDECTLVMNKDISTPYNCAMHISELLCTRSVLAEVNGKLWDMHRPLENDCELRFLHFKDENPDHANKAYWRSCSFLLGYLLETSFKDNFSVDLCSFPPPNIRSGSFVYDANINVPKWTPTSDELRCLSVSAQKLYSQNINFERIKIKQNVANEMFKYNKFKLQQIPSVASRSDEKDSIIVYKVGDYVDISKGPMISNTSLIGRYEITCIYDIESPLFGKLKRIQGVSIPKALNLHHWTFAQLSRRAYKPNIRDLNYDYSNENKSLKNEGKIENKYSE